MWPRVRFICITSLGFTFNRRNLAFSDRVTHDGKYFGRLRKPNLQCLGFSDLEDCCQGKTCVFLTFFSKVIFLLGKSYAKQSNVKRIPLTFPDLSLFRIYVNDLSSCQLKTKSQKYLSQSPLQTLESFQNLFTVTETTFKPEPRIWTACRHFPAIYSLFHPKTPPPLTTISR